LVSYSRLWVDKRDRVESPRSRKSADLDFLPRIILEQDFPTREPTLTQSESCWRQVVRIRKDVYPLIPGSWTSQNQSIQIKKKTNSQQIHHSSTMAPKSEYSQDSMPLVTVNPVTTVNPDTNLNNLEERSVDDLKGFPDDETVATEIPAEDYPGEDPTLKKLRRRRRRRVRMVLGATGGAVVGAIIFCGPLGVVLVGAGGAWGARALSKRRERRKDNRLAQQNLVATEKVVD